MNKKKKILALISNIGLTLCAIIILIFLISSLYGKPTGFAYLIFVLPIALILAVIN